MCADLVPQAMLGCMYPESDLKHLSITDRDYIIQTPSFHGRDDYYGEKSKYRFLIWDHADKQRLARWLTMDPDAMSEEMNSDDPAIYVVPD